MIETEINVTEKEKRYALSKNKKLNKRSMDEVKNLTGGKFIAKGVRFGSQYVESLCSHPNSNDHTYDKFDNIDICLKCLLRVFDELNKCSFQEEWWKKGLLFN